MKTLVPLILIVVCAIVVYIQFQELKEREK